MGKGSKNNRNRRKKVTRRAKSNTTKFKNKIFSDETVRRNWNNKLTRAQNYARLGIVNNPNENIAKMNPKPQSKNSTANKPLTLMEVDFVDITAYRRDPNLNYTGKSKYHLPPVTRQYFRQLVDKYGDQYEKMAWDIKLNPKQHTKNVCKKQCEKLLNLEREEQNQLITDKKEDKVAQGGESGRENDEDDDKIQKVE